ncbi:MAG: ERF family protein [Pseudomonadota bacterium]
MADTALVETQPSEVAVQSESVAMISMIERAASNPDVDPDKLERLYALHERMQSRAAETSYYASMAKMQPELPVVEHTKKISYYSKKLGKQVEKSSYTPWEDIDEKIRPIYTKYGFALSFAIDQSQENPTITAIVMHEDGHKTETPIRLPADMSGEKNVVQGVGSTITYGKRYAACAALNITTRGANGESEDDDGESSVEQVNAYMAHQLKLFQTVSSDMRDYASTRQEAKDWYARTKEHNKEWRKMPTNWRKMFFDEVFLPFCEHLPEVKD